MFAYGRQTIFPPHQSHSLVSANLPPSFSFDRPSTIILHEAEFLTFLFAILFVSFIATYYKLQRFYLFICYLSHLGGRKLYGEQAFHTAGKHE